MISWTKIKLDEVNWSMKFIQEFINDMNGKFIFNSPLELIIFLDFTAIPLNSTYFPSKQIFMKISWKLKAIVPKDCSHWTPSTTSAPPIGMESIGLFNTYSPMDSLILWHFLSNLWFLHLQPSLDTLVLDIGSNSIHWLS